MSAIQRLAFRLVVSAIPLLSVAARAGDTQLEPTPIGIGAKVGFGSLTYHNTCVWFRVLFIAGDFFEGFKEHKTVNGLEFRRRKEKPVYFPDQLLVELEAFPRKCDLEITPPDYAAGLLEKASFKVAWKTGRNEARPVELLATEEHHSPKGVGWSYVLTVPSTAVPLTDSLLIDVWLRSGICRMHLIASLDARQRMAWPSSCG